MKPPAGLRATLVAFATVTGCALIFFSPIAGAATESVVYSFQNNGKDGYFPGSALIDSNDTLYGTTENGGTGKCDDGCGTVFSVDPATGTESVLHSFRRTIGYNSEAGRLLAHAGALWGTTNDGGRRGAGSVFSLDARSGMFKERYYFCNLDNCTDGSNPNSGLVDAKRTLYGTTNFGGTSTYCEEGCGTVFVLDPKTRAETVLYSGSSGNRVGDFGRS